MTPFRLLAITPPAGPVPGDILDRWLAADATAVGLAVLLREPGRSPAQLLASDRLAALRRRCRDHAIPILLSVDPGLPLPTLPPDITGLHLRGDPTLAQLAAHSHRAPVPRDSLWLGRSCHGAPAPGHDLVDYTLFAPVFPPRTGVGKSAVGLPALQAWTAARGATIFALGGISPATAPACLAAGAHGLAGIGVFFGEPAQVEQDVAALRDLVAASARHVEPLPPR